jgi:hypothetical protein
MQLPASITRRGRAPATPTSNRAAGTRGRRAPRRLAGLALAALSVTAFTGAVAEASAGEFAERLRQLDPGAQLGGNSIVGTRPGQQLAGVPGRPNFIAALGDGQTIHGASKNDQLGAAPNAEDVKIFAPAEGHSLIVAGPGSKVIVSGEGHNQIYSHAGGATIMLKSPGNEVIATGLHDRILCDAHASDQLIRVATAVRVSRSCEGRHNTIEPAEAPLRRVASATVTGSGTNADPYTAACDPETQSQVDCTVSSFAPRQLPCPGPGNCLWETEYVPAYTCPQDHPYLLNQNYAPAGTSLINGVQVVGLGPVGVSILTRLTITTMSAQRAVGTANNEGSTATNWDFVARSYQVILHCTSEIAHGWGP